MRPMKQILLAIASVAAALPAAAAAAAPVPGPGPGPGPPTSPRCATMSTGTGPIRRPPAPRRCAGSTCCPASPPIPPASSSRPPHIAALADNGHSALLPPQWPSRYKRSPVHLGLFADGLYVIAAPPEQQALLRRRVTAINGQAVAGDPRRLCPLPGRRAGLPRPVRHPVHGDSGACSPRPGFGSDPDRAHADPRRRPQAAAARR